MSDKNESHKVYQYHIYDAGKELWNEPDYRGGLCSTRQLAKEGVRTFIEHRYDANWASSTLRQGGIFATLSHKLTDDGIYATADYEVLTETDLGYMESQIRDFRLEVYEAIERLKNDKLYRFDLISVVKRTGLKQLRVYEELERLVDEGKMINKIVEVVDPATGIAVDFFNDLYSAPFKRKTTVDLYGDRVSPTEGYLRTVYQIIDRELLMG